MVFFYSLAPLYDNAVVTNKINDLAVTTAKINDDAVTLTKLENGTQGDVLYYGVGGAPTRLGAGTAGQVLVTGGAGANPSWAVSATTLIYSKTGITTETSEATLDTYTANIGDFTAGDIIRVTASLTGSDNINYGAENLKLQLYDGTNTITTGDMTGGNAGAAWAEFFIFQNQLAAERIQFMGKGTWLQPLTQTYDGTTGAGVANWIETAFVLRLRGSKRNGGGTNIRWSWTIEKLKCT